LARRKIRLWHAPLQSPVACRWTSLTESGAGLTIETAIGIGAVLGYELPLACVYVGASNITMTRSRRSRFICFLPARKFAIAVGRIMTPCCLRLENELDVLILTDAIRMRSSKAPSTGSASSWMRRYLGAAAAKTETQTIKAGIKPLLQVRWHRSRAIAPSWNDADNITVGITMVHPTHGHYGECAFNSIHASAIASRARTRARAAARRDRTGLVR
jgi:hypothetical protein